jgi:pimeloyl-ACP methyl ester carboxylesterase
LNEIRDVKQVTQGAVQLERPIRQAAQFTPIEHDGSSRQIACLVTPGEGSPLVWLGGFRSDMRATKAEALAAWAGKTDHRMIRFDYTGHGESEGKFADSDMSMWLADTLGVIKAHARTPPILIGSSMGGWIALLAARLLRGTALAPAALVLIAPATDFTEKLMWDQFPETIKAQITETGQWLRASLYSAEPYPITRRLIEDGRKHLLLGSSIMPGCPVHILQGMQDTDVPWQHAMTLLDHLPDIATTLTLIKDGDHRLSRDQDLALIIQAVKNMTDTRA